MAPVQTAFVLLCLAVTSQRSFVDTAALPPNQEGKEGTTQAEDTNVQELEELKHSIGKTLQMMKEHSSVYTNVDGHKQEHLEAKEEIKEDGKLIASVGRHVDASSEGLQGNPSGKVRTDIDIPSKGIHKSIVQQLAPEYSTQTENGNRRSLNMDASGSDISNNLDKYNSYSGVQYSPLDMAEYVFWTGDEKGVTLAIEEFLQEGLMSREEAISFLQEIKYNLDYLKSHYTQLGLNSREHSKEENFEKVQNYNKIKLQQEKPELRNVFDLSQLRQQVNKKNEPEPVTMSLLTKGNSDIYPQEKHRQVQNQDESYDEVLERLRMADFLYTEYSLEEVIYQLAKVMFTQSLTRGSAEAQEALQKFTTFLEIEAEKGHISRALEKKVLDVLIASLSDTLTEHPELLPTAREGLLSSPTNIGAQNFLRQILELSSDDKSSVRVGHQSSQIKETKSTNHVPLGLGKYKNP